MTTTTAFRSHARRHYDPLIPGDPGTVARLMVAAEARYDAENERRQARVASRYVLDRIEETDALREHLAIG